MQPRTATAAGYTVVELAVALALTALLTFGAARTITAAATQAGDTVDALALERQLRTAAVLLERDTTQVVACRPDRHGGPARYLSAGRVELHSDVDGDGIADLSVWTADTGQLVRHVEPGDGTCTFGDFDDPTLRPPGEVVIDAFELPDGVAFTFDRDLPSEPPDPATVDQGCAVSVGQDVPDGCRIVTVTLTGVATGATVTVPIDATWPVPTGLFTR